jgi:hypothetical protein
MRQCKPIRSPGLRLYSLNGMLLAPTYRPHAGTARHGVLDPMSGGCPALPGLPFAVDTP